MRLRCPKCSTAYRVDDKLITGKNPTFRCSRCGHVFIVEIRVANSEEQQNALAQGSGQLLEEIENEPPDDQNTAADRAASAPAAYDHAAPTSPEKVHRDDASNARAKAQDSVPQFGVEDSRFDPDEDFFIFPKQDDSEHERKEFRAGGQFSVLPFVSLFAILLFVFSLVTMTYQIDPVPLESMIRSIPWLGAAVFDSKHFKHRLEITSLASTFQPVLGDREVVVISGKLFNRNLESVENVRIQARIYDADGKPVGKEIVYLGNALSLKNIQDMTTREIELLQSLKPQSVYRIEPNQAVLFTIVLPKPKTTVAAFSCQVLSAESTA